MNNERIKEGYEGFEQPNISADYQTLPRELPMSGGSVGRPGLLAGIEREHRQKR